MMEIMDSKFITDGKLNETYNNAIQNGNITQELIDDIIKRNKGTSGFKGLFQTDDYYDDIYYNNLIDYIRKLPEPGQESFLFNTALKLIIDDCRLLLVYYIPSREYGECTGILNKLTEGTFSLTDMYKLRFIKQYDLEAYNNINNESDIKNIVKEINKKEYYKSDNGNTNEFENFEKNNGNYLRNIIKQITDKNLSNRKKAFSYLDICFFNFILNNNGSTNAKNFAENLKNLNKRNNNYHKTVDACYLEIFICGIETLSKYYYNYSDIDRLELQEKINKIAEWSKPSVPLLLDTVKALEAEIETIMEKNIFVPDEVLFKSMKKIDKIKCSLPSSKATPNN